MNALTRSIAAAVGLFVLASAGGASAQANYPNKAIRLIVPFPAGGGTDIIARVMANKLTENVGWQIVVDNKSGAGGNIGAEVAARGAPDGYTLLIGQTSNLTINPTLYSKLGYDPLKDFAPITLIASNAVVITVAAKSPHVSLPALIAAAKAKPEQLVFGSPGSGTVSHLAEVLLEDRAGVKFIHVPYKGAAQGLPDLIGGRVTFYMGGGETLMPQIKAGNIRPLAVTTPKRSPSLPDVPTVAESGYKGFEATTWFGILTPAGTPQPVITLLSTEITKAMQAQDVRDRLVDGGGDVTPGPAAFAAYLKSEYAKWSRIVKVSGAKVD
jgi:tripartite-type tricarboxylate transporter receptor subunit TctC